MSGDATAWREMMRTLLVVAPDAAARETEDEIALESSRVLGRLPTRDALQCVGDLLDALRRADRWAVPDREGRVVLAHVHQGLRLGRVSEFVAGAIWCVLDRRLAVTRGLLAVLAHALHVTGRRDMVLASSTDFLDTRGISGFAAQLLERDLRYAPDALEGQGWVFEGDLLQGGRYSFDPVRALWREAVPLQPVERIGLEVLDLDVWKRRVDHLPVPCGWDERVGAALKSIGSASGFGRAAASTNDTRAAAAQLYALRAAEHAVRRADASGLRSALIAACLSEPSGDGRDQSIPAIGAVLRSAELVEGCVAGLLEEVAPLLDSPRIERMRLVAPRGVVELAAAGLEEAVGPDGFAYLGVIF